MSDYIIEELLRKEKRTEQRGREEEKKTERKRIENRTEQRGREKK